MRNVLLLPLFLLSLLPAALSQTPAFAFDAVVIKPSEAGLTGTDIDSDDTTFRAKNVTLRGLLVQAYGVRSELISGIPSSIDSQRFDINAKVVDPDVKALASLTRDQRRAMLAVVLADRFKLKVHSEDKILPVYEMVVVKDGAKFKQSHPLATVNGAAPVFASSSMSTHNTDLTATAVPISQLAEKLAQQTDRPVIDKTGLTSRYDLHLTWSTDRAAQAAADNGQTDIPPVLFTALQEQLGLKLVPGRGPVPTIVVDHVETPSAN